MISRLLYDIVILLWIISEIVLARVKHSEAKTSDKDKLSLRVLWMSIILGVTAGVFMSFSSFGVIQSHRGGIESAGLVLIVAGLVIRWVAILTLWKYFTVDVSIASDHRLVKSGLYKLVRHPSYTGSLLSFLGLGMIFLNWVSLLLVVVPITGAFIYRIKVEETALIGHFGEEYRRYAASTKRLIPKIY
ncbi:MAG TPA: isoprenylcysteine carboxylmethyltransferase family protein [candidate division Zixibacteria bacterium]|nr:isoprenylcysteine carboxylmethyltransferase family protein [candidate division Zixibacteria bacterium]